MEPSSDPISVRVARLNAELTGKTQKFGVSNLISTREGLLDTLQTLYEECSIENLRKQDKNVEYFVQKHKPTIDNLKRTRINLTDFDIKKCIGRGHFGDVHVVVERNTKDIYAMKSIRKCDSLDQNRISFIEERNIMAFNRSPWLTSLQYALQDNTHLYFVMEFHSGGDLLGLLYKQGGTLPESAATFYLAEVILALKDLHEMGYVHRDVKPDNILLDRCGHIKLADFGSAAKLNSDGYVSEGPPVGTPDYVAPEILEIMENPKGKTLTYGVSCDFWSVGILAYELTIGNSPFSGSNSTVIYSKIMNHGNNLKFPPDVVLSQGYITFIKSLVTDVKKRLNLDGVLKHDIFKTVHFASLKEQVPPYVPKIGSLDDTGNFSDVPARKKVPSIQNFKKRTQFSGRNLPFIGFTYTPDNESNVETSFDVKKVKDETIENLRAELDKLRRKLSKNDEFEKEKRNFERKLEEKGRKLESVESVRNRLEKEMANNLSECTALRRTLDLERKDRLELEKKALDLIRSAKLKWENEEKRKVDALTMTMDEQIEKIRQLSETNKVLEEQLQHALKMEARHKMSMETVENLSRRSVIGLESRLDKMTSETQNAITDLQGKLNEQFYQKNALERQISKLKEKENSLNLKLKSSEDNFKNLNEQVDSAENLIRDLEKKVSSLEKELELLDSFKEENEELKEKINKDKKTTKDLENRFTHLELESKKKTQSLEREIENLRGKIGELQEKSKKIGELEDELQREKEKSKTAIKQIQDNENDPSELKELRMKFWKMEKEMNNLKIDKRIVDRELKESDTKNKELNEEIEKLKAKLEENRKIHEFSLLEMNSINDSISTDLMKIKSEKNSLFSKFEAEKRINEESKNIIVELKSLSNGKDEKIRKFHAEMENLRGELCRTKGERDALYKRLESSNKERGEVENELEKTRRENKNLQLNSEALREACVLLEGQVVEYEKLNLDLREKERIFRENTEKLIADLCASKEEVREAKKTANEEKSYRLMAENRSARLKEDLEMAKSENENSKRQAMDYKEYANGLNEELTRLEEKLTELETSARRAERKIEDFSAENRHLKEEVSEYITQLHKCREMNYKLNHQVNELKENKTSLLNKINEIDAILQEKNAYYKERELKSDATIKQQIKLIDYLQTKIDENQTKKKTFTFFGHSKKENTPPVGLPMNYKDLESQLQRERAKNKQLQEEIFRLKAENAREINEKISSKTMMTTLASPKSKMAMEKLVRSPTVASTASARDRVNNKTSTLQRMRHNIPHRFESKMATKIWKCARCAGAIAPGRYAGVCKECEIVAHTNCCAFLPSACGIPREFVELYKENVMAEKGEEEKGGGDEGNDDVSVQVEGWIKIPGSNRSWEKRYAILTDSRIDMYEHEPKKNEPATTKNLARSFEFAENQKKVKGKVIMEPLISEIDAQVAKSDLPFLIKIEVSSVTDSDTCWPKRSLEFLTLSARDKETWYKALRKVLEDEWNASSTPRTLFPLSDDHRTVVNCVLTLTDDIMALGTDRGLLCRYDDELLPIGQFDAVHQMALVGRDAVAMLADAKSRAVTLDACHLINVVQCAAGRGRPALKCEPAEVGGRDGFHLLAGRGEEKGAMGRKMFCLATEKQLIIVGYEEREKKYVALRFLDTAEPTGTVLFTEHSIIVGADKFFEIDIATFKAEEFLDSSNPDLRQVLKCHELKSFPLSALRISTNPKEYLIAFNEFFLFVDEYGSPSRKEEWTVDRLPLALFYAKPYLYIVEFSGVEIRRITENTCREKGESEQSVRIRLEKFSFVGASQTDGIYVFHENSIKVIDARKIFKGGDESGENSCEESVGGCESSENCSDRFSFTSSMVQSLDGHLDSNKEELEGGDDDDFDGKGSGEKCVTFAQTSF